ncbi:Peptidase S8, subtilisin-related [Parasponia andersonii]|uniref:Peptidase S8, subtilisin-related n=1 Tax=Parasponia andersonii TaxID=3476 RepID=A0A2P5BQM7_PARAD|nr:Peptidase S8, subtilisin-related [Parasponia andersonii]
MPYFDVYELEKDYSGWFVKFRVDFSVVFPVAFPEAIRNKKSQPSNLHLHHYVFSLLCELDEVSYLVLQIKGKVIRYYFRTPTFGKICDVEGHRIKEPVRIRDSVLVMVLPELPEWHDAEIIASNDDLLSEILFRLPIKALVKFKSVSKHWRSLISDPKFDAEEEKLSTMPMPPLPDGWDERDVEKKNLYFGESMGRLHLIVGVFEPQMAHFDVSEMEMDHSEWFDKKICDVEAAGARTSKAFRMRSTALTMLSELPEWYDIYTGLGVGTVRGGATQARVGMFKVCWSLLTDMICSGADILKAFDKAVCDGVDVFSVSIATDISSSHEVDGRSTITVGAWWSAPMGMPVRVSRLCRTRRGY